MCGIYGYYDIGHRALEPSVVAAMAASIGHRGPDSSGVAHDRKAAVAVGCERLEIIDPEKGDQPFLSDDGRVAVVQNGAIFNYRELSDELAVSGHRCQTGSDTEVILRQYERFGIEMVHSLNGMFSIAIHDRNLDCLYLIRDRIGEKPLFYAFEAGRLVFGSEIKAVLEAIPAQAISRSAVASYLTFNYVPPPTTIYDADSHLMPGHWMRISREGNTTHRYWDAANNEPIDRSEPEWTAMFNDTLHDAVRLRLRSDAEFGAFLSGGVDSSTIVGLMSQQMSEPVHTFSIGFDDARFDESEFARKAADRFGTTHRSEIVGPDVVDAWPRVLRHCDQPHGDASFLPTLRLAELAAGQVRVVLTGDGADELFGGYDSYRRFFDNPIRMVDRSYLDHI